MFSNWFSEGKNSLIDSNCQLPWYKFSNHSQLQPTMVMSTSHKIPEKITISSHWVIQVSLAGVESGLQTWDPSTKLQSSWHLSKIRDMLKRKLQTVPETWVLLRVALCFMPEGCGVPLSQEILPVYKYLHCLWFSTALILIKTSFPETSGKLPSSV